MGIFQIQWAERQQCYGLLTQAKLQACKITSLQFMLLAYRAVVTPGRYDIVRNGIIKVTGSLRADTLTVYLIKRYFIVFCHQKYNRVIQL